MSKPTAYSDRARLRLSRTPEFYRRFIQELKRSGLTAAAYCRKHRVSTGTVRKYLRAKTHPPLDVLPRRKPVRSATLPALVPLRSLPEAQGETPFVLDATLPDGTRLRFARVDDRILSLLLGERT